jgi:hypothetical protein
MPLGLLLIQPLQEDCLKEQLEQKQQVDEHISSGQHSRANNNSRADNSSCCTVQAQWLPDSSGQLHAVRSDRF